MAGVGSGLYGHIGEQQGVVIQTQVDVKHIGKTTNVKPSDVIVYPGAPGTAKQEIVRVEKNDLVFRVSKSIPKSLLNNAIPVVAHCNGLYTIKHRVPPDALPKDTDSPEVAEAKILQALSEKITVLGAALNNALPIEDRVGNGKTQLTVRVAGTSTLFNNGFNNIVPGDTLLWDLYTMEELRSPEYAKLARFGRDPEKVPLKIVPLSFAHQNYGRAVKAALKGEPGIADSSKFTVLGKFGEDIKDLVQYVAWVSAYDKNQRKKPENSFANYKKSNAFKQKMKDVNNREFDAIVTKCLKSFLRVQQDTKRREIGKALSFSKPGQNMDVLLGTG